MVPVTPGEPFDTADEYTSWRSFLGRSGLMRKVLALALFLSITFLASPAAAARVAVIRFFSVLASAAPLRNSLWSTRSCCAAFHSRILNS